MHFNEEDRHQRRLALMRMQGKINRQENIMYGMYALAFVLAIIALALGGL